MLAREYPETVIDDVLVELRQRGLQSDRRFTESFIHVREQRGCGPLRIRAELRERGVAVELIDEFVDVNALSWGERLAVARRKRFGNDYPRDYRERARQARFLQRRGFTTEQIRDELKASGA